MAALVPCVIVFKVSLSLYTCVISIITHTRHSLSLEERKNSFLDPEDVIKRPVEHIRAFQVRVYWFMIWQCCCNCLFWLYGISFVIELYALVLSNKPMLHYTKRIRCLILLCRKRWRAACQPRMFRIQISSTTHSTSASREGRWWWYVNFLWSLILLGYSSDNFTCIALYILKFSFNLYRADINLIYCSHIFIPYYSIALESIKLRRVVCRLASSISSSAFRASSQSVRYVIRCVRFVSSLMF